MSRSSPFAWGMMAAVVCTLAAAIPQAAQAQERVERDSAEEAEFVEPILVEETMPNEVGEWDLRFSNLYATKDGKNILTAPHAQLFFGFFDRIGAEIGISLVRGPVPGSGFAVAPISVGLKWLAVKPGDGRVGMTFGLEVEVPNADVIEFPEEAGEGGIEESERVYEYRPFVAFLTTLGSVTVQGNAGWAIETPRGGGTTLHTIGQNWSAVVPLGGGRTQFVAEVLGELRLDGAPDSWIGAPGLKYTLPDDMAVGLSVPVGLNAGAYDWGLVIQWQKGF